MPSLVETYRINPEFIALYSLWLKQEVQRMSNAPMPSCATHINQPALVPIGPRVYCLSCAYQLLYNDPDANPRTHVVAQHDSRAARCMQSNNHTAKVLCTGCVQAAVQETMR